jgi:ABC-type transport system substrate-binding protein
VNDPQLNAKINKAKEITDPTANAKAWADLDKEVTNQAYFVTWLWDNDIILASTNVKAVPSKFNSGAADMVFSSLK